MQIIIKFESANDKKVDLIPAFGRNIATTKMATMGPETAPITLIHTVKVPPNGPAVKAKIVDIIPTHKTSNLFIVVSALSESEPPTLY